MLRKKTTAEDAASASSVEAQSSLLLRILPSSAVFIAVRITGTYQQSWTHHHFLARSTQ